MDTALIGIYVLVVIFGVITVILWFILPFAVFGIKDKMDELIAEQKRTNDLLRSEESEIGKLERLIRQEEQE